MQAQSKRYVSCVDTAKLVRKALKAEFPSTKFSVRSSSYSGGASIDVSWTDGPTGAQVDAVTFLYRGATFDGMIDLKSHHDTILSTEDGFEVVHFGADYIHGQRGISPEWRRRLEAEVCECAGIDSFGHSTHVPVASFVDRESGGVGLARDSHRGEYASTLVHQLAAQRDRSKPCDHSMGVYGLGSGWYRCKGCGFRTLRAVTLGLA